MIFILIVAVAINLVWMLPVNDLSPKRPVDFVWPRIKKWWASYPKFRVVQTRNNPITEQWYKTKHKFTVEKRRALWPFWIEGMSSWTMEGATTNIAQKKNEIEIDGEQPIIHNID